MPLPDRPATLEGGSRAPILVEQPWERARAEAGVAAGRQSRTSEGIEELGEGTSKAKGFGLGPFGLRVTALRRAGKSARALADRGGAPPSLDHPGRRARWRCGLSPGAATFAPPPR